MKTSLLLLATSATLSFASSGAELIKTKCASCHMLTTPKFTQIPTLKYPPMDSVVFHINLVMNSDKSKKAFIADYALNPHISKSVCESNKVKKYGVMPSMKGAVTKEELEKISSYMLKNFPSKEFSALIKEMQMSDKMRALKTSPFLINNEGLPHMTRLLVHNWDKKALGLTLEQKAKLLVIRKETLKAVKKIKKQLKPLEDSVAEAMIDREDPKSVEDILSKIVKLKVEATRVHLKCISKTTSTLTEEQVEFLLPFWE